RLIGAEFKTKLRARSERPDEDDGGGGGMPDPEPAIEAEGFDVRTNEVGRTLLTLVDGKTARVTLEEYKERLAARLVEEAPTLDAFRQCWLDPAARQEMISHLPDAGRSAPLVR